MLQKAARALTAWHVSGLILPADTACAEWATALHGDSHGDLTETSGGHDSQRLRRKPTGRGAAMTGPGRKCQQARVSSVLAPRANRASGEAIPLDEMVHDGQHHEFLTRW